MYSKVANFILSNKHNSALPGEKHQVIYLPDGTYNPAVYSGPGTNLEVRLKRGDEPLSAVDKEAQAHDIRYLLADTENDVKSADETMINKLNDVRARKLDSNFNINQAELIRLKYYANKLGVPTSFFTSFGHGDSQAEKDLIPIAEKKLQDLEQEGYGKVRPKRLYKDDKGYYTRRVNSNDGVKQYLKTGSNKSGRDLYIINMNNPKAVPKPRTKKVEGGEGGEGEKSKLTKMIPSGSDIRTSGSSSNTGVPSTKQEVVNAYNEGMNRNPLLDQYKVLVDKYKEDEKELAVADEKDKPNIRKKMKLNQENLVSILPQLSPEEQAQARIENMSNFSGDISRDENPPRLLRPQQNDNYESPPPSESGDDFTLQNVDLNPDLPVPQPVIEPVIETESIMPLDNTPEEKSVSAIEEKIGEQIGETKDEGDLREEKDEGEDGTSREDLNKLDEVFEDFYSDKSNKRDFARALRYDTLTQMEEKRKKQDNESKNMSFEDLASARKLNPKTEKQIPSRDVPSSVEKKFTNFTQIKTPARRIKILLGEAELTDGNRQFLQSILDKIPIGSRVTKKILNDTDRETYELMWNDYSNSIRTPDQKEIINKYLSQVGFGGKIEDIDKEGLTTSHIEEMIKKYEHINLPVIASDEILTVKKGLKPDTQLVPFIMNLDPSEKPGSHWVAVVIDNRDKYVGYYDSLCIHPTKQILDDIKELVKSVDRIHMFKFKFNTVRDQSKNSGKCGMYSMIFLHNILNGMSFKKASGFYDRDYENNEDKLVKSFKFL